MFKVFYDDGTTYTGDPFNAPVLGALIVVEDDKDHGRRIISMCDYFCWDDRGDGLHWWGVDFIGMIDYLTRPGVKRILIGRIVANTLWNEIYQKAMTDCDFHPKTAWSPGNHGRVN